MYKNDDILFTIRNISFLVCEVGNLVLVLSLEEEQPGVEEFCNFFTNAEVEELMYFVVKQPFF